MFKYMIWKIVYDMKNSLFKLQNSLFKLQN